MTTGIIHRINLAIDYFYNKLRYKCRYGKRNNITVMSATDTVNKVISESKSVCRYGDGELNMVISSIIGYDSSRKSGFQTYDHSLGSRLKEILRNADNQENCIVCLPGCMYNIGTSYLNRAATSFWEKYSNQNIKYLDNILHRNHIYGETNFTRFYLSHKDKSRCKRNLEHIKKIWDSRNILIVEGEKTRLGVGNDLFDNANSIERILCPAKDAWSKYDEIYKTVSEEANKKKLKGDNPIIIIALGMTATVLAYDLSQENYQAIDLGHLDIEYEWMRMGATHKVAIKGKFTNEASDNDTISDPQTQEYASQILTRIE